MRAGYFLRSVFRSLLPRRRRCLNCGGKAGGIIQRKAVVTALVRCADCRLLYRVPTDPPRRSYAFYQSDYSSGFSTDCPSPGRLAQLIETGFAGSAGDYRGRIALLEALGAAPGARVLDFGSSWGYGVWQLRRAGFDAAGYEVSRPRAAFARERLGVRVDDELSAVGDGFDVLFSSHVLEHVPAPSQVIAFARQRLRPGGLWAAVTPNGSVERLRADPIAYRKHWGRLHPNMLDETFYREALADCPKLLAGEPYDLQRVRQWDRREDVTLSLAGGELLCAAVML